MSDRNGIEVVEMKTKSGKMARVAQIVSNLVDQDGPEQMHWAATAIAQDLECSHYRVVNSSGQLVATARAGALPTQEQTARTHGD